MPKLTLSQQIVLRRLLEVEGDPAQWTGLGAEEAELAAHGAEVSWDHYPRLLDGLDQWDREGLKGDKP